MTPSSLDLESVEDGQPRSSVKKDLKRWSWNVAVMSSISRITQQLTRIPGNLSLGANSLWSNKKNLVEEGQESMNPPHTFG